MTDAEYQKEVELIEAFLTNKYKNQDYLLIISALFVNAIRDMVKPLGGYEIKGFLDKHLGTLRIMIEKSINF